MYPFDVEYSPITDWVSTRLFDIAEGDETLQDNVFAKVGASSLDSHNSLYCFEDGPVDLGRHTHLQAGLDFFRAGDADGTTPFDRNSLSAISGKTASWAISGSPSPMDEELDAIAPRFALIHYGTNDMGMGSTYASALPGFYEDFSDLIDELVDAGVVPIAATISHRGDRESADLWVSMYNAVIRGIAQREQVLLVDWWLALDELPHKGLSSDGIHMESHSDGACLLDADGLEHGYNVRNLMSLEVFDRARRVLVDAEPAPDDRVEGPAGTGSAADPIVIDQLPFVLHGDTSASSHANIDAYPACGSDSDESGPELWYRLDLADDTPVRIQVLDRGDVDIDVHLLSSTDPDDCIERDHRLIERTLGPGSWYLSLDSWVDGDGDSRDGEYLLAIVPCDPTDDDCEG